MTCVSKEKIGTDCGVTDGYGERFFLGVQPTYVDDFDETGRKETGLDAGMNGVSLIPLDAFLPASLSSQPQREMFYRLLFRR